jgi:hypothetical protein
MTEIIVERPEREIVVEEEGIQGPPGGVNIQVSPTPPTTRSDGSPLQVNDIWFQTTGG